MFHTLSQFCAHSRFAIDIFNISDYWPGIGGIIAIDKDIRGLDIKGVEPSVLFNFSRYEL